MQCFKSLVAIIIPVVLGHLANNSKNKVILDAILNNNENDFSLNLENPSSEKIPLLIL